MLYSGVLVFFLGFQVFGLVLIVMAAVRPLIQRNPLADVHQMDYVDRAHSASH